ncbi:hypothetical protein [Ideonella sp.]|uniref:hypothetical protein n=1 Tax=Ideonella sp. TaxID=1929293 RepID=UPI002B48F490|nr:hypothetical protein [Ideonella sp.]HJV71249.1 hypothetical protein [Ideonella sp.]
MTQVTYKSIPFTLSEHTQQPAYFVLGVRKSGSSILNSMVTALAQRQGLPFVDIPGQLFKAGIKVDDWQKDPALSCVLGGGNVYGGFRNFPAGLQKHALFMASKKVLLVRDPRDALVSEYFSNAFSHSLPQEGDARDQMLTLRHQALQASIEAFVLERAAAMGRTLMEYAGSVGDPLLKLYRYEDVITRKRALLEGIGAHFGWRLDAGHLGKVLEWADVLPDEERPTAFVRRVLPGDHRNKLAPAVIAQLNARLAEPMRAFGYPP